MNKYYQIIEKLLDYGKKQTNKKGNIILYTCSMSNCL